MPPASAARTTTAASSPRVFIGYLLPNQTMSPEPTTASGSSTTLHQNTSDIRLPVMFNRRSSGSFGRIEIRSSSLVSQLVVFGARPRVADRRQQEKVVGRPQSRAINDEPARITGVAGVVSARGRQHQRPLDT